VDKLINTGNTCCFSGHRPEKLPWRKREDDPRCLRLKEKIRDVAEAVYLSGVTHFICGMARGCDMYFCEELISLREEHPDITIEAAIPCEEQAKTWTEQERSRYFGLIAECDIETLVGRAYTPDCMIKRNRFMVDNSCVLIAVYDGTLGGTMQTVNYARRKGIDIIQIEPC